MYAKSLMKAFATAALSLTMVSVARAQDACSYIAPGAVLTAGQWNYCFQQKQNLIGFNPVNKSGDTMAGKLNTMPSSALGSGFSLPPGVAPTSPKDGDVWTDASGLYVQIDGSTIGPVGGLPTTVAAHYALLGPTSGIGVPSFRALADSDLPGGVTGSGSVVKSSAPSLANATLTTPTLGVATGTSINKVAITAPATSATLTISDGQTLTASTSTSVGQGQYLGTSTNDNAAAGNIGEFVSSEVSSPGISLTTTVVTNLTSVSLTAGDWDVACQLTFVPNTTTVATYVSGGVSSTSSTFDLTKGRYSQLPTSNLNGSYASVSTIPSRFNISSPTTVYCLARSSFTTSTMTVYGFLRARRAR